MFAKTQEGLFSLDIPKPESPIVSEGLLESPSKTPASFFSQQPKSPILARRAEVVLESVKFAKDIDLEACKAIAVESFIHEYRDIQGLPPEEVDAKSKTWEDVKDFYERDCDKVFGEFCRKELHFWVVAKIDDKIVGWAIFERENYDNKAVYMDILAVHPDYQRRGIGSKLLKSLITLNEIPDLTAINLLLRTKNTGGDKFYAGYGFVPNLDYKRGNFVDPKKLQGRTWNNPELQNQYMRDFRM